MALSFLSSTFQFIPVTFTFVIRPNFTDSPDFRLSTAVNTSSLPSEYVPPPHPDSVLNDLNVLSPPNHTLIVFISEVLFGLFENSMIIVLSRFLALTEIVSAAVISETGKTTKRLTTANNMIIKFTLE